MLFTWRLQWQEASGCTTQPTIGSKRLGALLWTLYILPHLTLLQLTASVLVRSQLYHQCWHFNHICSASLLWCMWVYKTGQVWYTNSSQFSITSLTLNLWRITLRGEHWVTRSFDKTSKHGSSCNILTTVRWMNTLVAIPRSSCSASVYA
jgi:hypothetical protein